MSCYNFPCRSISYSFDLQFLAPSIRLFVSWSPKDPPFIFAVFKSAFYQTWLPSVETFDTLELFPRWLSGSPGCTAGDQPLPRVQYQTSRLAKLVEWPSRTKIQCFPSAVITGSNSPADEFTLVPRFSSTALVTMEWVPVCAPAFHHRKRK